MQRKIIILTESGADIPAKTVRELKIHIVPMHVALGERNLNDGAFPQKEIFEYYKQTRQIPSTSGTNPQEYREAYLKIKQQNPDCKILHLCYSAVTTATWQNAIIGSEGISGITHIDTKAVSAGQGNLVIKAAKYLEAHPNILLDELVGAIHKWIENARMYFIPENLDYLLAGGRVSNAQYIGANILHLKPMIEIKNGYLVSTKKYRGRMRTVCLRLLEDVLKNNQFGKEDIYLLYSEGLSKDTLRRAGQFLGENGYSNVRWVQTGCVISTHAGPGAFGVGGIVT
ncbi:DegV family protein [Murimonas intestini]|uniref:DegV family protein with EDD domain n=1 Tax=Murimonas intestini TaxID=1337051 RepID=A0AB73T2U7_9FIRM|nr:DegV family protein [Murimonas intestini]MCR1841828.1 DegV family protein [Murimonas intestini]MCR1865644.1 DegV family protein [Murimonas intestini]MCR1883775.1 DegV family protein [Murimonas intestini]